MEKLSALAVTAITDFVLAGEVLFLAGLAAGVRKSRFSAAWYWSWTLLLLGVGALLGGIDHGFFEPAGLPRVVLQRSNWVVLGGMTFCLLMATAKQFFPPAAHRWFLIAATVQFAVDTAAVLTIDDFLDVILNYLPVIVLLLAMSCLRRWWYMVAGILLQFAASAIQAMGVDALSPLDHNGLYHVISMVSVAFLYLGGTRMNAGVQPATASAR